MDRNLFPEIPQFRETVLEYLAVMTQLGHAVMAGSALSLGEDASYFRDRYTTDPLILSRKLGLKLCPSRTALIS